MHTTVTDPRPPRSPSMRRTLAALAALAVLAGCATPYQASGLRGGFREVQLGENLYRVEFQGNGFTSTSRAEDYALLRCAELTLSRGYTHFGLSDSRSDESTSSFTTPTTTTFTPIGGGAPVVGTNWSGAVHFISKPSARNTVVMFRSPLPPTQGVLYDATFVCRSLGGRYDVSCGL
ncbi:MAG: hypothetical protein KF788_10785 [Piscinibacter sp.]|nr:hypothetical protein [Piscinibacter sp.]